VLLLSGCLSALHPLFTEKDLIFNQELIGSWLVDDDTVAFERVNALSLRNLPEELQKLSQNAYHVIVKEKNKDQTYYFAFLTRIGDGLYLDYFPEEDARKQQYSGIYKQQYVPLHSFYRLKFKNNHTFETNQFDKNYLRGLIDKKQVRIEHEKRFDGSYLITASTEELRQYVLKYGDVEEAYGNGNSNTYTKLN
jgi:hypothetical protein